jgi:uncharacterized protein YbjT (DUF2867 family)
MILVLGSSGTVGREVVKELLEAGVPLRAGYLTRPPATPGVEGVRLNLATGNGLDAALSGITSLFLLTGSIEDQTGAELRAVEAARRAGVKRLVKLSVWGAEGGDYSFAKIHRPVERAIEASGIPYTFLRPNGFMQNFITYDGESIRTQGAFSFPGGDARVSHVDVRDIARVAARTLTRLGHEGKAYDLSGPEALTFAEVAEKLSAAAGRAIRYVDQPEAEFRKSMVEMGAPEPYADALLDLSRYYAAGKASRVTNAVKEVTGNAPISFDQFAGDHASALR